MKYCPKCNQTKALKEFGNDASRPDGKYSYCKECRRKGNPKLDAMRELAERGYKVCVKCEIQKPLSAFHRDATKFLGVSSRCAKCCNETRRNQPTERRIWNREREALFEKGLRRCFHCKDVKKLKEFTKRGKDKTGYSGMCKPCYNESHRDYVRGDYVKQEIYERDEFECYLCLDPVNTDLRFPHPMSPSIDHVQPISKGGLDCYENVKLTHLYCNQKKSDTDPEVYMEKLAEKQVDETAYRMV